MSPAPPRTAHPKVTDLVGRTPLVELTRVRPPAKPGIRFLAKLESRNPGGSVKDRPAAAIVREALGDGRLGPGKTLLDATSGNTGIAYAWLGTALGFAVQLCLPANAGAERKRLLEALGARLVLTDALEGADGAIREARRRVAERPADFFYADQYSNPANWRAHYETTAVEILEQTGGEITHFVAGLGTTGTLVGVGRRLKEERPDVTLVAVQPDSAFHGLEGLKHLATAIVPSIYDPALADVQATAGTETAYGLVRRLAWEEGLLVGPSSGAALAAALETAEGMEEGTVVMMFPDGGERYLSQPFWSESPGPEFLRRTEKRGC